MVAKTGAERVKKNYDANRESILEKKRQRYRAKKLVQIVSQLIIEKDSEIIELEKELPSDSMLELPNKSIFELPNDSELVEIPFVELIEPTNVLKIITKNINSLEGETDGTKKIRISNFKTLINILNPTNYQEFIKALKCRPSQTIKLIKSFQYKPNKTYASNTLITLYKAVLFYFDKFNIKVKPTNKSKWEDAIQIYDAIAVFELKEKNKSVIPSFEEYLQRVLDEFGLNSREYLILKM